MKMKGLNFFLFCAPYLMGVSACTTPSGLQSMPKRVLQQYSFAELDRLMADEQRPIAVFLHADWCSFCKNMEQTSFQNEKVIDLLNKNYYFVSFDGEQRADVALKGQLFRFNPSGRNTGTHELAIALGTVDGVLTYPTFVLLNPAYELVFQYPAFLSAEAMIGILEAGKQEFR